MKSGPGAAWSVGGGGGDDTALVGRLARVEVRVRVNLYTNISHIDKKIYKFDYRNKIVT